jgi:hypothetical protein
VKYKKTQEYGKVKRASAWLAYVFCISLVAFYSLKKPEYNWDMLGYMATVISMENKNIDEIHRMTYESARENIPAAAYHRLIDSSNAYRKKMNENAADFYKQLPFYIVKPLYNVSVFLFYKAGVSLPASTVLPSVIAYFFISILLVRWLHQVVSFYYAFFIGLALMLSPPLLMAAKLSTPDGVSAFLILSAFYFLLERPSFRLMSILLIISILARLDNILLSFAVLFWCMSKNDRPGMKTVYKYAPVILLMVGTYFSITATVRGFGWSIFYYPSFMDYLHPVFGLKASFLFRDYLHLLYSTAITGLYNGHFDYFLLIWIILSYNKKRSPFENPNGNISFYSFLIIISLIRFLLHPDLSDRFFIAYYLVGVIFLTKKIAEEYSGWPTRKFAQ